MSEETFVILLSLTQSAMHGYVITTDTERLSEGRIRLSTGTLHGALKWGLDDASRRPAAMNVERK